MRLRHLTSAVLPLLFVTLALPLSRPLEAAPGVSGQLEFGVQMARRGLWAEALFRFRAAQDLDPNNPRILNNLAVAYEAVGQFETALSTYQEAIRIAPGNAELKRNYAQFLEFYQGFRPPEPEETAEEAANGEADEG